MLKRGYMVFFKDLYFAAFYDEINFEDSKKNLLENTNKEAI
jgi:hypothetical protein